MSDTPTTPSVPPEDAVITPPGSAATRPASMLVVVMGAKGGCGATLIATNLAAHLAADHRTCLVDLDLCKGDVAGFLGLKSGRSLNLLLEALDQLDEQLLAGSVDVHPSGLHVLVQPYDLTHLHHVTAEEVNRVLGAVRSHYEIVVVDVGSRIDVAALTAALAADVILLVTTPDVVALRDAKRVLALMRRLQVETRRVHLVVNEHDATNDVSVDEIATQLAVPVAATVARDVRACGRAVSSGDLLVEVAPNAAVTRDLQNLWSTLQGEAPAASRSSWFPFRR